MIRPPNDRYFGPTNSTDITIALTSMPPWKMPMMTRNTIKNAALGEKLCMNPNKVTMNKLENIGNLRPYLE